MTEFFFSGHRVAFWGYGSLFGDCGFFSGWGILSGSWNTIFEEIAMESDGDHLVTLSGEESWSGISICILGGEGLYAHGIWACSSFSPNPCPNPNGGAFHPNPYLDIFRKPFRHHVYCQIRQTHIPCFGQFFCSYLPSRLLLSHIAPSTRTSFFLVCETKDYQQIELLNHVNRLDLHDVFHFCKVDCDHEGISNANASTTLLLAAKIFLVTET